MYIIFEFLQIYICYLKPFCYKKPQEYPKDPNFL